MIDFNEARELVGHRVRMLPTMGGQITGTLIGVCDQPSVIVEDAQGTRWTYAIGRVEEMALARPLPSPSSLAPKETT